MYKYNRIFIVMAVIAVLTSLFTFSAFAEGVDGSTVEPVVTIEESTEGTVIEDTVSESTSSTNLDMTNEYLRYITGILIVFLIIVLFYFAYKFFAMFF